MPNTLGLHRLHRVHLLTCWAVFATLSLGACGGDGSSNPGQPSIVVAMTPATMAVPLSPPALVPRYTLYDVAPALAVHDSDT